MVFLNNVLFNFVFAVDDFFLKCLLSKGRSLRSALKVVIPVDVVVKLFSLSRFLGIKRVKQITHIKVLRLSSRLILVNNGEVFYFLLMRVFCWVLFLKKRIRFASFHLKFLNNPLMFRTRSLNVDLVVFVEDNISLVKFIRILRAQLLKLMRNHIFSILKRFGSKVFGVRLRWNRVFFLLLNRRS